jgi:hypothetical protein
MGMGVWKHRWWAFYLGVFGDRIRRLVHGLHGMVKKNKTKEKRLKNFLAFCFLSLGIHMQTLSADLSVCRSHPSAFYFDSQDCYIIPPDCPSDLTPLLRMPIGFFLRALAPPRHRSLTICLCCTAFVWRGEQSSVSKAFLAHYNLWGSCTQNRREKTNHVLSFFLFFFYCNMPLFDFLRPTPLSVSKPIDDHKRILFSSTSRLFRSSLFTLP